MKLRYLKTILAALFLCFASVSTAQNFKFIALGDMPYNIPEDYVRYERLIQRINTQTPAFSIFIGDTKSGSTPCSDEYNLIVEGYFKKFNSPLLYSPGDNEWTDCHRPSAGAYDPIERLQPAYRSGATDA